MADAPPGETLSPAQARTLLEGVDDAFRDALHGRYGGGIEAVMLGKNGQSAQTLRLPNSGAQDRILLLLQAAGQTATPQAGGGIMVGSVSLSDTAQDVSIAAEIFDTRDSNEASDASALVSGVVFALTEGGLAVVRSAEAARQGGSEATRRQRGWLASQSRTNPSRAIGLGANGHRRAGLVAVTVPATSHLLAGLGVAASRVASGRLTLVVETSPAGLG